MTKIEFTFYINRNSVHHKVKPLHWFRTSKIKLQYYDVKTDNIAKMTPNLDFPFTMFML